MAAVRATVLLLLVVGVSYFAFSGSKLVSSCEAPGVYDFIQYYSAALVLEQQQNPYDPSYLLAVQEELCGANSRGIGMWNPPWVILYLLPFLQFEIFSAALCWLLFNIFILLCAGELIRRSIVPKGKLHLLTLASALLFAPALFSLQMGQLGGLLCLCFVLFLVADRKQYPILAGLALVPLSIKPHLFYLLWVYLGWRELHIKRGTLLIALFVGTVFSAIGAELVFPNSLGYWISQIERPPINFIGGTFLANIRELSMVLVGSNIPWILMVVPLCISLMFLFGLLKHGDLLTSWDGWCRLMCLSVWTSPYGWVFDYTVLLPFQVLLVKNLDQRNTVSTRSKWVLVTSLLCINLVLIGQNYLGFDGYQHCTWFPPVLLAIWEWHRKLLKSAS